MLSFVQFVTMDSLSAMYFPLIEKRGYLFIFFFILIVVVSVALMNIVTASLVEVAITGSKKDAEMEDEYMRRLKPEIIKAFEMIDVNKDGLLSLNEVMTCQCLLPARVAKVVPQEQLVELFDVFDTDNSGMVDLEEFIDGVTLLAMDGISTTDLRLLRLVMQVRVGQEKQLNELFYIRRKVKRAEERQKKERAFGAVQPCECCKTKPPNPCTAEFQAEEDSDEEDNDEDMTDLKTGCEGSSAKTGCEGSFANQKYATIFLEV